MKKYKRILILTFLGISVLSCSFLDGVADLIRSGLERFSDSPTPVIIQPTPTLKVITPDEDLLPPTSTPLPKVEEPSVETPELKALNPDGPYILYGGKNGVWISNPDGSFLTQIFTDPFYNNFRAAVAPDGSKMALVTRDDSGYHLIIIELPSGQQTYVAQLLEGFGEDHEEPIEDPRLFVEQALSHIGYNTDPYSNVAWQPGGGRLLAFVGAINADTTELYTYDTQSQEIRQLTDDPSYAVMPSWSPDGATILTHGVGWESPIGGALTAHNKLYGVWAVDPLDGQLISMPQPQGTLPGFVGWHDDQHYLYCDDYLLRSVDIITGDETEVIRCCCYNEISQSTNNGALLLNFSLDCSDDYGEGIFYLASPFDTPRKVYDQPAWELSWLPESNVFFAYPEVLVSGDFLLTFLPPVYDKSYLPAVSTNGLQAWKAYEGNQPTVKVYVPGDDDWQTILYESVEGLIWGPQDPGRLLILLEDGRLMTAQFPNFIPEVIGQFDGSASEVIYVP